MARAGMTEACLQGVYSTPGLLCKQIRKTFLWPVMLVGSGCTGLTSVGVTASFREKGKASWRRCHVDWLLRKEMKFAWRWLGEAEMVRSGSRGSSRRAPGPSCFSGDAKECVYRLGG